MKKTLYLVSTAPTGEEISLLPASADLLSGVRVVLIEDAVRHRSLPFPHVFALSDDMVSRGVASPFPSVSYQDIVRMIFEADHVVVV